mmetsp:Transcript_4375/g.5078  ORF Transcript_4375/g.5078 Transcript_4375/m.5078 type:complete len:256 (-) Transcript_4375:1336-2103(-)|eukprot:CAMPEP_0184014402 /NCGR_PEP_ID=MMETSP0954-20121128/5633_1 /TAXON_ID=627963 /ORGANISM="Aplanochytrium sp, Strain PBS07" /LENGTH=255 /DNA_ID=CAMNT_0026294867 /DNA_START=2422 /DNA_END=3189 /DNA_ORIENTATION=-
MDTNGVVEDTARGAEGVERMNSNGRRKLKPRGGSIEGMVTAAAASDAELEQLSGSLHSRLELATKSKEEDRRKRMEEAVKTLIECVGEDPEREGLVSTPARFAKALLFLTKGYAENLKGIVNKGIFVEDHQEMVIVRDIDIYSLCEHHMVPFIGKAHVGYIPNDKILGLSKIARIIEMFSRRLQVQERLTTQVAEAMVEILNPAGVGVILECQHMCMVMRGVQKQGAMTTTSSVRGIFKTDHRTRQEFFSLVTNR